MFISASAEKINDNDTLYQSIEREGISSLKSSEAPQDPINTESNEEQKNNSDNILISTHSSNEQIVLSTGEQPETKVENHTEPPNNMLNSPQPPNHQDETIHKSN